MGKKNPIRKKTRKRLQQLQPLTINEAKPPSKSRPIHIASEQSLNQVVRQIFLNCLDQALANESSVLYIDDIEGVHQMRVGLRRLRAAFKLFRSLIPKQITSEQIAPLTSVLQQLGEARDWDVFIDESLLPMSQSTEHTQMGVLLSEANERRTAIYRQLQSMFSEPAYNSGLNHLYHWIDDFAWNHQISGKRQRRLEWSISQFAHSQLQKQHDKIIAYHENLEALDTEELHDLRIEIKKQRYAVEFLQPLYPKQDSNRYQRALKQLQDSLGQANDITTAHRLLSELPSTTDDDALRETIELWLGQRRHQVSSDWRGHWSQLMELECYW